MSKSKKDYSSVLHGEISSARFERSCIPNTVRENFAEKLLQVARKQFIGNHLIVDKGKC